MPLETDDVHDRLNGSLEKTEVMLANTWLPKVCRSFFDICLCLTCTSNSKEYKSGLIQVGHKLLNEFN